MKFRIIIGVILGVLILMLLRTKGPTDRPNIVLINIDDMGWKDVSFMGSTYYETPNIDSLARQGMIFTNGYAAAANCAPSRACLMTGQWTPRHGVYTVGSAQRGRTQDRRLIPTDNTIYLSDSHTIIPQVLQANGYQTCHAGKWHISEDPLTFGFHTNIGGGSNGHPKSYYPPFKNVKSIKKGKQEHLTDLIMEHAITFIEESNPPFFLHYAPYAVHTPIQPIDHLLDKYKNKPPSQGQQNAKYATMIQNLDRNIGLLISSLKKKGVFHNTLIIFTSDNGGLYGITQQKPLRAGKGSYYEGGIREPFFFVWPGKIEANTQHDVPITNLDLFPTILAATGIHGAVTNFDGENLLPVLTGKEQAYSRPLFWHFPIYLQAYKKQNNENRDPLFRTRPGSVIRLGEWKLHYYFEDNGVELYNLTTDIEEKNNLAVERPNKTNELLQHLKKWWKETNAPIPVTLNPEYEKPL